jgi:hypothetical protein
VDKFGQPGSIGIIGIFITFEDFEDFWIFWEYYQNFTEYRERYRNIISKLYDLGFLRNFQGLIWCSGF